MIGGIQGEPHPFKSYWNGLSLQGQNRDWIQKNITLSNSYQKNIIKRFPLLWGGRGGEKKIPSFEGIQGILGLFGRESCLIPLPECIMYGSSLYSKHHIWLGKEFCCQSTEGV